MFIWPHANQCWTWILSCFCSIWNVLQRNDIAAYFLLAKALWAEFTGLLCKLLQKGKSHYGIFWSQTEELTKRWVSSISFLSIVMFHSGKVCWNDQLPAVPTGLPGQGCGGCSCSSMVGVASGRQSTVHFSLWWAWGERCDFMVQFLSSYLLLWLKWTGISQRIVSGDLSAESLCKKWQILDRCIAAVLIVT